MWLEVIFQSVVSVNKKREKRKNKFWVHFLLFNWSYLFTRDRLVIAMNDAFLRLAPVTLVNIPDVMVQVESLVEGSPALGANKLLLVLMHPLVLPQESAARVLLGALVTLHNDVSCGHYVHSIYFSKLTSKFGK